MAGLLHLPRQAIPRLGHSAAEKAAAEVGNKARKNWQKKLIYLLDHALFIVCKS
jgi:hypothetical protein